MTIEGLLFILICICIYFLPLIIAACRNIAGGPGFGVFMVNLFLGWTVIGWFTALIMACTAKSGREISREEELAEALIELSKSNRRIE